MVMGDMEMKVDLAVIGAGPGGYSAAFRAADLGLDVALIDPRRQAGGVCLHEGCIPSKTLLSLTDLIEETRRAAERGVRFGRPEIDLAGVRSWKEQVIAAMASGLAGLSERRGVQRIYASARFVDPTTLQLDGGEVRRICFRHCLIASGSTPLSFADIPFRPHGRIINSTGALELVDVPQRLLVVGGGYVGLELGSVYAVLGSRVHLAELEARLLPAVDKDLAAPLQRRLEERLARVDLNCRIAGLEERDEEVKVRFARPDKGEEEASYDRVLVAMGRRVQTDALGLDRAGVATDGRGCIVTDECQRTSVPAILAAGDVCGGEMLAHTAMRQGRVAAETAAGMVSAYDVRATPAVIYTDPQIAWCGLSEEGAKRGDIAVRILKYPWKYSGRAQSMAAVDGLTKLVVAADSGRLLGVGVCGPGAEGLVAEGVLAIEMGAVAEDLALTLHPHPSLSETLGEAAELFLGSPTHLLPKDKH